MRKFLFPLLIIGICVFLAWKNYLPGTILSGWDTLHPEFNLSLYLERAFNGVWMEHQGLGTVASQAHVSELPRLLIVLLLNLFLPLNIVRYSFFFICLLSGALGVYFFSRYLLSIKWYKFVSASAFLASLFYIFNLTVVQQFYVPLEMFAVHYALLPWLFYLGVKFVREGSRKNLIWFSIVTLLSSSMAHTATLFYVYLFCLALFLVVLNFRKGILLVFLTILINSFWILPNLYYVKNHSEEVSNSKIHQGFSDEAFLQSKAFGDVESLALSKNFLFNWREYDMLQSTYVDLLDEWQAHLSKSYVVEIGYVLFGLTVFGLFVSVLTKSKFSVALLPIFLLSVFFWLNSNPPFGNIFDFSRRFDLFKEGFRFPFTKFSIILVMVLSVWFSYASHVIFSLLGKIKTSFIYLLVAILALFYFQLPSLQGNLISPSMKVKIPNEYFEIFDWFKSVDKNSRVAKLPLNTFWGWNFYQWNYQGAGFTWFGIPQPTLDREFDRWSKYNEGFYAESARALYASDNEAFEDTLQKYQVKYLLLDESIINAGGSEELLFVPEVKAILKTSNNIKEVQKFGFLTVYETQLRQGFAGQANFVFAPETYTAVNADLTYSQADPVYQKYGDYIEDENGVGYPFVNFDPRGPVSIDSSSSELIFENKKANSKVTFPVKGRVIESFGEDRGFKEANNCDLRKLGKVSKSRLKNDVLYRAEGGGVSCDFYAYDNLSYDKAYVLRIKGENKEGRSLKIYFQNWETGRMDLEELLPTGKFDNYFVVLPKLSNKKGYTLNLETRSFGRIASENRVENIEIYPFDLSFLTSLVQNPENEAIINSNLRVEDVRKLGTAFYKVQTSGSGLLVLGQGYEKGWLAFEGKTLLRHVKVDSWANGWLIPSGQVGPSRVVIVFWPQLLEWFGFLVLLGSFCGLGLFAG
jgi:hypothetical protein